MNNCMTTKIFTISKGLETRTDIVFIRIKSKDYNLLIMKDYLPIIGEIEGSIDIQSTNDTIRYEEIKGYYMHANNIFNLIIKEE
ncbi:MAG: hypothetical protein ACM3O4_00300 [Ignavibacteriales bacterium]